jgi:hypothetical protein
MEATDFEPGDAVAYIPAHALGSRTHPDIEYGVVSSLNQHFVFVRFGTATTAQPCYPSSLVKLHEYKGR